MVAWNSAQDAPFQRSKRLVCKLDLFHRGQLRAVNVADAASRRIVDQVARKNCIGVILCRNVCHALLHAANIAVRVGKMYVRNDVHFDFVLLLRQLHTDNVQTLHLIRYREAAAS